MRILPQAAFGLPVTIIILRAFFRAIPAELEESATLDGCGPQFHSQYGVDTARVLAYVSLAMVPALAFYAVAERQLVGGLASGATRG